MKPQVLKMVFGFSIAVITIVMVGVLRALGKGFEANVELMLLTGSIASGAVGAHGAYKDGRPAQD